MVLCQDRSRGPRILRTELRALLMPCIYTNRLKRKERRENKRVRRGEMREEKRRGKRVGKKKRRVKIKEVHRRVEERNKMKV